MRRVLAITLFVCVVGQAGEKRQGPLDLRPGMTITEAEAVLGRGTWSDGQFIANRLAIPTVIAEQTVIVTTDPAADDIVAVHIQFHGERMDGDEQLLRLQELVKRTLVERFGAPAHEERLHTEWALGADGPFLRLGIPARLDGRPVVEIAMTSRPIPRRERFWGVSER